MIRKRPSWPEDDLKLRVEFISGISPGYEGIGSIVEQGGTVSQQRFSRTGWLSVSHGP